MHNKREEGEEKERRTEIQLNRRRVTRAPELKLLPIPFSLSLFSFSHFTRFSYINLTLTF